METNNVLTTREYQIAGMVAKDLSEKLIADKLCVAEGTVHTHKKNIRKKWNVATSVGIAVKYLQSLDEPKKFVLACMFLLLQFFAIGSTENQQRLIRTGRKTVRVRRYES